MTMATSESNAESPIFGFGRDHTRETCGDTSEDEYTFIGCPLISGYDMRGKELKDAMRKHFLVSLKQESTQESTLIQS